MALSRDRQTASGQSDTATSDVVTWCHVAVLGMMGAGKTSFGSKLAQSLGLDYLDSDDSIATRYGRSGADLAAAQGIDELHRIEAGLVLEQLSAADPTVVSVAASVVDDPACVTLLESAAFVVWVDTPLELVFERITHGTHRRPMKRAEVEELFASRVPAFKSLADWRVDGASDFDHQVQDLVRKLQ